MVARLRSLPPLESGDHLTREEFHRRYLASPWIARAELIDGVVIVSSPASASHGIPHGSAVGWLFVYKTQTPGVQLAVDTTVFLDADNEVQPDACLYWLPPRGTIRYVTRRENRQRLRYLEGVPEFVFEVAASSASYDLHSKKRVYERNGVAEYVVWLIVEQRLIWFHLDDGHYEEVQPDERGVIASAVFPGLRLNVPKLLAGDDAAVVAELHRGAGHD